VMLMDEEGNSVPGQTATFAGVGPGNYFSPATVTTGSSSVTTAWTASLAGFKTASVTFTGPAGTLTMSLPSTVIFNEAACGPGNGLYPYQTSPAMSALTQTQVLIADVSGDANTDLIVQG